MSLINSSILSKIQALKTQIDAFGTIDKTIQQKINYKFRLDWNYYSNAMEGNSLTRQETRQLMMENITVGNKPLKDILEMNGHDKEVLQIMRLGKGEIRLSEKRIKEMHRAIMYESDSEKSAQIGEWKKTNNYLINYRGEKFEFTSAQEVPDSMHNLINTTNAEIDAVVAARKNALHPAEIAFKFHLNYIGIHPFYDGNGRTARLLMNLLLIGSGYPPVILMDQDRVSYYKHLADIQSYGAPPNLYYDFLGELLIRSLELTWDAMNGQEIDDLDDLDKEILLWKTNIKSLREQNTDLEYLKKQVFEKHFTELTVALQKRIQLLSDLFETVEIRLFCFKENYVANYEATFNLTDFQPEQALKKMKNHIFDYTSRIQLTINLLKFRKKQPQFNLGITLLFYLSDNDYAIQTGVSGIKLNNPIEDQQLSYGKMIEEPEIRSHVKKIIELIRTGIDLKMKSED